jgi:hypothetical protein
LRLRRSGEALMNKVIATIGPLLVLLMPLAADAQQMVRRVRIDEPSTQVGFPKTGGFRGADGFKAGLWTPIIVRLIDDEDGNIRLPVAVDGSVSAELFVETADADNVFNIYPQKFTFGATEPMQLVTYAKPSGLNPQIRIGVRVGDKTPNIMLRTPLEPVDLGQHLYLSLADPLPPLQNALWNMLNKPKRDDKDKDKDLPEDKNTTPRYAFGETIVQNLPAQWFGYQSVDLAILVTANDKFLDKLNGDRQPSPQLMALAEWVRRGGRLMVSIAPANREKVYRLLSSPAWQPALPPILTSESQTLPLDSLNDLCTWSGSASLFAPVVNREGQPADRLGVRLRQNPALQVVCKEPDGQGFAPLIARLPHGLGNITLVAFDVKDTFFLGWPGQDMFWRAVVEKIAPSNKGIVQQRFERFGDPRGQGDIASQLYTQLEEFDVPSVSFGWVVLFIFIYIIVVGPVDYVILKFVFKRLELTWVTFPAVVITVSLLAYFTAYAIKGKDLHVNKLDLVDIDMRDTLSQDLQPTGARVFGTTWFTIRSPRIQNYTIGIEPVPQVWKPGSPAPAAPIEPTMSWLGRPEHYGMGASGRGRSPGLFSRTYKYRAAATGLIDVPIPVWTTKSFSASWDAALDKSRLPLESQLTYEVGKLQRLTGTIKSNLPFNLYNVRLVVGDKYFDLPIIPSGGAVKLDLATMADKTLGTWTSALPNEDRPEMDDQARRAEKFKPSAALRDIMFHEKVKPMDDVRNHNFRALDFTWRCDKNWWPSSESSDAPLGEAILVAKAGRASGPLEELQAGNDPRLPTHLWLGTLPGTVVGTKKGDRPGDKGEEIPVFAPRPQIPGNLVQETFIRVILPVAPRK